MIDGEKESRGLRHCVDNSVLEESTEQETRQGSDDKKKNRIIHKKERKLGNKQPKLQGVWATGHI